MLQSGSRMIIVILEMKGRMWEMMGKYEVCVPVVASTLMATGVGGDLLH